MLHNLFWFMFKVGSLLVGSFTPSQNSQVPEVQANPQRKKIEWKKKKESKYLLVSLLFWWLRVYHSSCVAGRMLDVQK